MKRASQATWNVVHALLEPRSAWGDSAAHRASVLGKLEEIARAGEPEVIPALAFHLCSEDSAVRTAAANAIGRLFSMVRPLDYLQLDHCMRDWLAHESDVNSPWRRLTPSRVVELSRLPYANLMVGLAALHPNGYVREAAVEVLSDTAWGNGSELPFLLLRANDWIHAIRTKAAQAILSKTVAAYAEHFFRCLPLVEWLRCCGRASHGSVVEAAEDTLKTEGSLEILRQGLKSEDRWLRRKSLELAVASAPTSHGLLREALSNPDGIVRLRAARGLLPHLPVDELHQVALLLEHDRFTPIRCEAFATVAARLDGAARPELLLGLFDPHASVRMLCRYQLARFGVSDFRALYREEVFQGGGKRRRVGILGLGETGNREDAAELRPLLSNREPAVRKAAIRAVAELAGDEFATELVGCVLDPSPGVSRAARLALQGRLAHVDLNELHNAFETEKRFRIRKDVLLLFFRLPVWQQVPFIFPACSDPDERIASLAQDHLGGWRSRATRSYPSKSDLISLNEMLRRHGNSLSESVVRELKFWIETSK